MGTLPRKPKVTQPLHLRVIPIAPRRASCLGDNSSEDSRFPWGSCLALRCGSFLAAPLDIASGGRRHSCAIVVFVFRVPYSIPAVRAVRKEERSVERLVPPASARRQAAHHSPTPFQRRGCGLPSDLLGPRGAFTDCRQPLTLSCHSPARPSRSPKPPDALFGASALAGRHHTK
jgi:hypothetical protein